MLYDFLDGISLGVLNSCGGSMLGLLLLLIRLFLDLKVLFNVHLS